jgi:hypothetical protein
MGRVLAALLGYLESHPQVIEAGASLAGKIIDAVAARRAEKKPAAAEPAHG